MAQARKRSKQAVPTGSPQAEGVAYPFGYPVRAVQISPTTRNAATRLRSAFPTWQVDGRRDLVTTNQGIARFEEFRGQFPSSVQDWREVWALDNVLLTPLLARRCSESIPVEWPEPFPLAGQLCPVRDWPYDSYLVVYADRAAALADLARWHDGVALVWTLREATADRVRAAARALLAGDRSAVPVLAAALEQAGDPRAVDVCGWLEAKQDLASPRR